MIWVFHRRLWRNKKVLRQKPYRKRKKDGKWTNTGKDKGIRMILSEKVIALRKRMNWSQEELAEKLNISRQAVSKWEVGATIPDLDKILKMSELFGVSTDYLLKDEMGEMELTGGKDVPEGRIVSVEEANAFKKVSFFPEVYWLLVTAAYLAYSFYTGDQWHKSWIVWPVAGVLFAAVYALIREAAKKE